MKTFIQFFLLAISLTLVGCGKSKEPALYVLNPILAPAKQIAKPVGLRLGISEINIPDYLSKPQMSIYYSQHQSQMNDDHQWAENLQANITRIIRTNLSQLLPYAAVETSPWDIKFQPDTQLQVNINDFKVNIQGDSSLQADYIVYENEQIHKYSVYYCNKISPVNYETIAISMNQHINQLSEHIAHHIHGYNLHRTPLIKAIK